MMEKDVLLLLAWSILLVYLVCLNLLVWFDYSRYLDLIKRLRQTRLTVFLPFSKYFENRLDTSWTKWSARLYALLALLLCLIPLYLGLNAVW